jgi:hypothetical protein
MTFARFAQGMLTAAPICVKCLGDRNMFGEKIAEKNFAREGNSSGGSAEMIESCYIETVARVDPSKTRPLICYDAQFYPPPVVFLRHFDYVLPPGQSPVVLVLLKSIRNSGDLWHIKRALVRPATVATATRNIAASKRTAGSSSPPAASSSANAERSSTPVSMSVSAGITPSSR